MDLDHATCYRALNARDARFDGVFFVGVTSTRIYCRPVCTARTPGRDRCRFFAEAAQAEQAGFRPCLRCRPELAPGNSPVDAVRTVARLAAARIEAGALNDGGDLEKLSAELGLSSRHLRRAVQREFGVSPIELGQTKRLLLAKQLLTETHLPITHVAFASGFESVRRFNALFRSRYRLSPSTMRRTVRAAHAGDCIRLSLGYRPPFAWKSLLDFLAPRCTAGVECVVGNAYLRSVRIGERHGWLRVAPVTGKNALAVELDLALTPLLPAILARIKGLFDLDARPDVIAGQLRADRRLRPLVNRAPGLRVPGSFDGFELAIRAILGQRISVKAATTIAGRLASACGEAIETPHVGLSRSFPHATRLAETKSSKLTGLGISSQRAEAVRALARAVADGQIELTPGAVPEATLEALIELPGVGPWTAHYIVMRALRWPDAFPAGDLGLLKASGAAKPRDLVAMAESWRPWRAYAAVALWESLHTPNN